MAHDRTRELLDRLADLRDDPGPELEPELSKLLRERSPNVVAKAAQLVGELALGGLIAELRSAFEDRLREPVKRDPNCVAKTAIARALLALEDDDERVFLSGAHHVQREPVWGGTVDTAAELRGVCALGLLGTRYRYTSLELVRLLADPEDEARVAAARAVSAGGAGAEELLRLVILKGDPAAEVLYEAFAGLLQLAPERSLEFTAGFLEHGDAALRDSAALALGGSRHEAAFELLKGAHERSKGDPATLLIALATLRRAEALDYLLGIVAGGRLADARQALAALATHRDDPALRERVREAVSSRGDSSLQELASRAFL